MEIKREPERNHLSCVTLKTDYSEVSSVKMELHRNIEEFQWTPAYTGADLRGPHHVSLRRVPWTRTPPSRALDALYHVLHTHYFALHGGYRSKGRTNNYGKYVSIDIVYLTLQDLKKKHVYTYCLSTVYRVGAQWQAWVTVGFLVQNDSKCKKSEFSASKSLLLFLARVDFLICTAFSSVPRNV